MKKALCVFTVLVFLLSLASCGDREPTIAGTWHGTEGDHELVYIFREDGTGTATAGDACSDFTYVVEDGCLTVTLGGNTDTASVEITDTKLTITDEYGTTVLTREEKSSADTEKKELS